ncbi:MAG: 16S rRNA (cytosine(1402)-N(4))-methyltransferase, partial [Alphaproteobacteria bacterium]
MADDTPFATSHAATNSGHLPVMIAEVLAFLAPHERGIYVDGTFGGGGYSRALLAGGAGK